MKKSQISSTKLQKNPKFQWSITKSFIPGALPSFSSSGGDDNMGYNWRRMISLEFGSLGFAWDLYFGAWSFHGFIKEFSFFGIYYGPISEFFLKYLA